MKRTYLAIISLVVFAGCDREEEEYTAALTVEKGRSERLRTERDGLQAALEARAKDLVQAEEARDLVRKDRDYLQSRAGALWVDRERLKRNLREKHATLLEIERRAGILDEERGRLSGELTRVENEKTVLGSKLERLQGKLRVKVAELLEERTNSQALTKKQDNLRKELGGIQTLLGRAQQAIGKSLKELEEKKGRTDVRGKTVDRTKKKSTVSTIIVP